MKFFSASMNNLVAHRLGVVGLDLMRYPAEKIGDAIDRGLVLRRLMDEAGFGIVVIPKCPSCGSRNVSNLGGAYWACDKCDTTYMDIESGR